MFVPAVLLGSRFNDTEPLSGTKRNNNQKCMEPGRTGFWLLERRAVAYHGLTYRDANGDRPWVHLLFGSIALMFLFRVVLHDILRIW